MTINKKSQTSTVPSTESQVEDSFEITHSKITIFHAGSREIDINGDNLDTQIKTIPVIILFYQSININ